MGELTDAGTRRHVFEIAQRMFEKIRPKTVPQGSTQLRQVALDLCRSVCETAAMRDDPTFSDHRRVDEFVEEQSERVREIISAIPSAFHHWSFKAKDGRDIQPFNMTVADMLEAAKDVIETKPEDIIKAYGAIWTHVRALSEIRPDAKNKQKQDLLLHATKDGVEYVASLYIAANNFVSPLLEWAIIDALVLDRIMDFASVCSFTGNLPDTPNGQILEGPLLPRVSKQPMGKKTQSPLAALGQDIGEVAIKLVFESMTLAATWWISEALAGSEGLPKWILFTGTTSARWISAAIKSKGDSVRQLEAKGETNLRMLWDMGIAHERVPAMNIGLLLHLLYRLEERGAAFSPSIYEVLDKKARREVALR